MKDVPTEVRLRALAIVEREQKSFLSRARRIVWDENAAADVVQELRVQILKREKLPEADDLLQQFLFGMLTRVALRWRRKNWTARMVYYDDPEACFQELEDRLDPNSADADFGSIDAGFRRAFLKVRAEGLPPRCAEVFTKVLFAGIPKKEVAAQMGIKLATVKAQYQNALKKLRGKFFPGGLS